MNLGTPDRELEACIARIDGRRSYRSQSHVVLNQYAITQAPDDPDRVRPFPALRAQGVGDWPTYNRDLASTRFSPLTQITPDNVSKLTQAWTYKMRPDANSPAAGTMNQVTPIVVNGVMYLPAGNRVIALDPDTGKEIWQYQLKSGVASQRGVAYWPGNKINPPLIVFTSGHKIVALYAASGKLDPDFGKEFKLTMEVPFAGVPTIYKNII